MNNILDANAILRYLLNDIKEQSKEVEDIIHKGAYTISEVMCEVVYVLEGVYSLSRNEISDVLIDFLDEIDMNEKAVTKEALKIFKTNNLDYVDCLLVSRHKLYNDNIISFDKKLNKALLK